MRRGVRSLLALVLCATGGCAVVRGTVASYNVTENGQVESDFILRERLADGRFHAAKVSLDKGGSSRPDDRLLRALYAGTTAYYAGDYRQAATTLARAGTLADERFTKSASKGGLALMTNDRALPYMPGHNERLFIHYYALLARLGDGDSVGAGVEVRRLSWLLQQLDEKRGDLDRETRAVMRYVAGAAYEALGEDGDAEVAYRNAAALLGQPEPAPPGDALPPDSGDIVVVVELGFVAHKVEQALLIAVADSDLSVFGRRADDRARRHAHHLSEKLIVEMSPTTLGSFEYRDNDGRYRDIGDASWLTIAWPVFHRPDPVRWRPTVRLASDTAASTSFQAMARADVSDAVVADYQRDAATLMTRAILRAGVKYAAARAAEAAAEAAAKKDEKDKDDGHWEWLAPLIGNLFGGAVELAGHLLERADTRSWALLPGELVVVRMRVPAGIQRVVVETAGDGRFVLEDVRVPAGGVTIRSVRRWDDRRIPRHDPPAIATITQQQ